MPLLTPSVPTLCPLIPSPFLQKEWSGLTRLLGDNIQLCLHFREVALPRHHSLAEAWASPIADGKDSLVTMTPPGCLTAPLPGLVLSQQSRQGIWATVQLHTNLPFEKSLLGVRAQDIRLLTYYLFKKDLLKSFKAYKHLPFSNLEIKKHNC